MVAPSESMPRAVVMNAAVAAVVVVDPDVVSTGRRSVGVEDSALMVAGNGMAIVPVPVRIPIAEPNGLQFFQSPGMIVKRRSPGLSLFPESGI